MTHVPYRGTSENITALLARQLDCIANSNAWQPIVEAGQGRLLAVWTRERLRSFPDAPTTCRTSTSAPPRTPPSRASEQTTSAGSSPA